MLSSGWAGRRASGTWSADAVHNGIALGTPAQHPACEVRSVFESGLLQDHGGLRGARAGATDGNDGTLGGELRGAFGKFAERDEFCAADVSQGTDVFRGFA